MRPFFIGLSNMTLQERTVEHSRRPRRILSGYAEKVPLYFKGILTFYKQHISSFIQSH